MLVTVTVTVSHSTVSSHHIHKVVTDDALSLDSVLESAP